MFKNARTFFKAELMERFARQTERSGGQKGKKERGLRKEFYPPSFFVAAEFRANKAGAPPKLFRRFLFR